LAQLFGQSLTGLVLNIGDHHAGAVFNQHTYGACAQTRCAAGDNKSLVIDLHELVSLG